MPGGSIKKTVSDRGFGFIIPEGREDDVFFHVSAFKGVKIEALGEGDQKDEDWEVLTQERVITREEKDEKDKIFFCDKCGEPI